MGREDHLNHLKFSFVIVTLVYSKRETRRVSWEDHILEILSGIPCLLKLPFLTFCRYCVQSQRIDSFFAWFLNGMTTACRREWKEFFRYICSRVTRYDCQPSRTFSAYLVKRKALNPSHCPCMGIRDGAKLLESRRPLPLTSWSYGECGRGNVFQIRFGQ